MLCFFSQYRYVFKVTMKWLCSSSLCCNNSYTQIDTGDKIRYYWTIQRHNRKTLKRILAKENWKKLRQRPHLLRALVKTDFLINSKHWTKWHCSLFPDFKNGDENIKIFLKKKSLKIIGKEKNLSFSNSNQMQLSLNASRAWQTFPAGSFKKREPSKKHPKNKLSLVTSVGEPKN